MQRELLFWTKYGFNEFLRLVKISSLRTSSYLRFIRLCYPFFQRQFEILFCMKDSQDPAVAVVKKLMESYPEVNSRLFTGAKIYLSFQVIWWNHRFPLMLRRPNNSGTIGMITSDSWSQKKIKNTVQSTTIWRVVYNNIIVVHSILVYPQILVQTDLRRNWYQIGIFLFLTITVQMKTADL